MFYVDGGGDDGDDGDDDDDDGDDDMFCMISSICRGPTQLNSTIALLSNS